MHEELANPPDTTHGRKRRLELVYRRIEDLKPDPRNPRHHSRRQIKQLTRSIETFGFTVPALVDCQGNVIAGHGRILACRELGWSEIRTIPIDGLGEWASSSWAVRSRGWRLRGSPA
jgi:hypothetical protein